ncbi:MAG: BolA family transcriptional regulator [Rhodospirillales bacterium CG15_BIG_FIL_POST_REV_8_21_14_020_66_15]|nr:MAG: BolA family transcriptional regulator [Rhodospirillales bacterium CG15_BIG_FIL_POST_REV_8_21_14_020_66_15]
MQVQRSIEIKLAENLAPEHLEVINESHMHSVPPGSESHFKVIVVSPRFDGLNRVKRHQAVNAVLADELAGPVHALSMETYTAGEWQARGGRTLASPRCAGGSKADAG